eukprot:1181831-Prorocentrum_minimum.AAC.1
MSAVLRREPTAPIVAKGDRARVLRQWSNVLGCEVPIGERVFPFASIRSLSPEDFVKLLADMGVQSVVAGPDYRFGFKV